MNSNGVSTSEVGEVGEVTLKLVKFVVCVIFFTKERLRIEFCITFCYTRSVMMKINYHKKCNGRENKYHDYNKQNESNINGSKTKSKMK